MPAPVPIPRSYQCLHVFGFVSGSASCPGWDTTSLRRGHTVARRRHSTRVGIESEPDAPLNSSRLMDGPRITPRAKQVQSGVGCTCASLARSGKCGCRTSCSKGTVQKRFTGSAESELVALSDAAHVVRRPVHELARVEAARACPRAGVDSDVDGIAH